MAKRPIVLLCRGSDCRRRRKKGSALVDALRPVATIEEVGCQEICDGPVAGTMVEGTLEWFREVDGEKARRSLVELLIGGKLAKPLRKRRVGKRAGRRR